VTGGGDPRLIAWVPNALSVLRLVLAGLFPFVHGLARPWVVIGGGLSDWLDGLIARRFDVKSVSGALLDGIADKLFVVSVLLTLALEGRILWWEVLLLLTRDLAVAFMAAYAAWFRQWASFRHMRSHVPGKLATALVFAWFITLFTEWAAPAEWPLFWLTVAVSVLAALDYFVLFVAARRALHRGESPALAAEARRREIRERLHRRRKDAETGGPR
jgi:phosphatidylglycerophosphate synthase